MSTNNPKPPDFFVKVPQPFCEAMMSLRINSEESRVLWAIIRKTFGWRKERDWIALNIFCSLTGLLKPNVCRAIARLIRRGIVIKTDNKVRININTSQWRGLSKPIKIIRTDNHDYQNRQKPLSISRPKKERAKENLKKETIFLEDSLEFQIAKGFFLLIKKWNPSYQINLSTEKQQASFLQQWAKTISAIINSDNRDIEDIKKAILFSQMDDFWRTNILTPTDLRKHFDKLLAKAKTAKSPLFPQGIFIS